MEEELGEGQTLLIILVAIEYDGFSLTALIKKTNLGQKRQNHASRNNFRYHKNSSAKDGKNLYISQ